MPETLPFLMGDGRDVYPLADLAAVFSEDFGENFGESNGDPPFTTENRSIREKTRGKNEPVPGSFSRARIWNQSLNSVRTWASSKFLSTASYIVIRLYALTSSPISPLRRSAISAGGSGQVNMEDVIKSRIPRVKLAWISR